MTLSPKKKKKNLLAFLGLKNSAESLKNVPYDFLFNTEKELNYTLFLRVFQREWN